MKKISCEPDHGKELKTKSTYDGGDITIVLDQLWLQDNRDYHLRQQRHQNTKPSIARCIPVP
jgi:hypothetical protein